MTSARHDLTTSVRPTGSYGVDAPWVPWMWCGYAVLYVWLVVASVLWWNSPWWVVALLALALIAFVLAAALFWYVSLRGKFVVWDQLLRSVPQTTTRVLDLGCGRGAISILAARALPDARVTGIDIWRKVDQSGNSADAFAANTAANDVADRVQAITADMTELPFDDAAFDLVTADVSIHNIPSADGRETAVQEAWRVVAPGGTLLVVDIQQTKQYVRVLNTLGAPVETRPVGWRMWWSGPWMSTTIVRASKPPLPSAEHGPALS